MRSDEVPDELRRLAYDFFFWFSRFESALKERRYLVSQQVGARAKPNWDQFVAEFRESYTPSVAAKTLIEASPQRQVVGEHELTFEAISFPENCPQLDQVVTLLKTARNNLFHGGKHGSSYWDDPERVRALLAPSITILGELAQHAGFGGDYTRYY